MPIADAVALGILDAATVESIQDFPTVSSDPNWTFWHQLKRFFAHYTRDADAPMRREDEGLRFWVPPVLHPSIRHLLVTSPALYDEHLHRTFLDEETEILATQQKAWMPGNRVFQIRTHIYPRKTILDLYNTWDVFGVSETGQHIFAKIQTEIERDPNVKHGIITHVHTIRYLDNIAKNENVCFLTGFPKQRRIGNRFPRGRRHLDRSACRKWDHAPLSSARRSYLETTRNPSLMKWNLTPIATKTHASRAFMKRKSSIYSHRL